MFRRSFFASCGAFLVGLLPFKRDVKADHRSITDALLICNHIGCGNRLRKGEHLVCDRHPAAKNNRRYVIAQGGSFPTPDGDPNFYPVDHDTTSESKPRNAKAVTFAKLDLYQEPVPAGDLRYPRYPTFRVMHTINLGTIDELVVDYRKKLETAARFVDADVLATAESVQAQQARFDAKYPRGEVHEINPDICAMNNFTAARRQYLALHSPSTNKRPLPSQALAQAEGYSGLGRFGCSENEWAAREIVEWLVANGDNWAVPFCLKDMTFHPSHWHDSATDDGPDYKCSIERYLVELSSGLHEVSAGFVDRVVPETTDEMMPEEWQEYFYQTHGGYRAAMDKARGEKQS